MPDTDALADLMRDSARIVAFTGAGISTESGIPDFRSPGGVWTRYDPREFTFDKYVGSAEVRANSWAMRKEFLGNTPAPNPAHLALAELDKAGRSLGVITQNIDGLHQLAGSTNVVEIHGTAREVMCIGAAPVAGTPDGCGFRADTAWALDLVAAGTADPRCPDCGGLVKSATVSFGQMLFPGIIEASTDLMEQADLVLAIGSSLQVFPAADLPVHAVRHGAQLAIINDEPTPLDSIARLVVTGRAGEVLPPTVRSALA
ncbi:NAD-dependent deacetylase [Antricoccus suffuscus]|uniref:protein acetyllysine N-acetyltransferase n=1 Tax=Antricoccus suffuscus TaxID=1629062 RepID=A0A2T1A6N9_9ACTN|nr:Sir2 family NAD-dependent protein deacetylase [Antricoccus suffuscus]PRZ44261.1 NAD-dependent deacetylase [Antricoccus suffuscus]